MQPDRILFIHVRDQLGGGLTVAYQRSSPSVVRFSFHQQRGTYNKKIGRVATSGRLRKGKFQTVAVPKDAPPQEVVKRVGIAAVRAVAKRVLKEGTLERAIAEELLNV